MEVGFSGEASQDLLVASLQAKGTVTMLIGGNEERVPIAFQVIRRSGLFVSMMAVIELPSKRLQDPIFNPRPHGVSHQKNTYPSSQLLQDITAFGQSEGERFHFPRALILNNATLVLSNYDSRSKGVTFKAPEPQRTNCNQL